MTAPKITATGRVVQIGGGAIMFDGAESYAGDDGCRVPATPEQETAYAPLLFRREGIRITIEPADAPSGPDLLAVCEEALRLIKSGSVAGAESMIDRACELARGRRS